MKIFLITDTHFGARSNNIEWLDSMFNWVNLDLIPDLRKRVGPDDVLVHLGDVFDNRQTVGLLALSNTVNMFDELSKIFKEIHILCGNHDIWKKNSNDVTSLDSLKHINNVKIYKEPETLILDGHEILMMPWRPNVESEIECISMFPGNYLMSHTSFIGMKMDGGHPITSNALSLKELARFKRIMSGHIHKRQSIHNIDMLGNPYQMTRSDMGNTKGYHIFDPSENTLEFVENKTSPRFIKLYLKEWAHRPVSEMIEECKGCMVDLYIPEAFFSSNMMIHRLARELNESAVSVTSFPYNDKTIELVEETSTKPSGQMSTDIVDIIQSYVDTLPQYDETQKTKFLKKLNILHTVANEI